MAKKNGRNTKGRIVAAAWKLFYEQGYENTTVEDIVYESETSKGSFYHYFKGKDALMGSLSVLFDEKYEELRGRIGRESLEELFVDVLGYWTILIIEAGKPLHPDTVGVWNAYVMKRQKPFVHGEERA